MNLYIPFPYSKGLYNKHRLCTFKHKFVTTLCTFKHFLPQKGKVQNKTLPEAQQAQVIESLTNSVNNSVDAAVDQC